VRFVYLKTKRLDTISEIAPIYEFVMIRRAFLTCHVYMRSERRKDTECLMDTL